MFYFFGHSRKNWTSWGTSFNRVAETLFYESTKMNKKNFSFVNYLFFIIFEDLLWTFGCLANIFRQVQQNCILRVQRSFLMHSDVLNKISMQFLSTSSKSECFQGTLLASFEATIYVSNHFQRLCCQLEGFKQNFFGKLLKLHSTCQDEHFDELFPTFKNFLPHPFRNLKWRWSAFQQNSSTWSSKLQTVSPIDPFDDSL